MGRIRTTHHRGCRLASGGRVDLGGVGVFWAGGVGGSVFFPPPPAPIVWATRSRTDMSRPSQPDGGLRDGGEEELD